MAATSTTTPDPVTIDVKGQETVNKAYATITAGAKQLDSTQAAIARLVVAAARGAAPVRTGTLRGTIAARVTATDVTVAGSAVYAGVQEWGWAAHHIRGRHYLARGVMTNQQGIVELYAQGLQKVVDDAQAGG